MEARKSSIVTDDVYTLQAKGEQFYAPTWVLLVGLIISLIVLKSFIYIKDPKRHGK